MNAQRPDDDLERLLADDGGELGALYRRLPRAEPPRRLDRSVLGEATRAVHGSRPRGPRWLVGFGSAAGLVLAAGIAWHVGHEGLRESTPASRDDNPAWVPVTPLDESAVHRAPPAPAAAETPAPAATVPAEAAPAAAPPAAPTSRMRKPASPAPARDAMKAREPVASPPSPPASPVAAPTPAASDTSAPSPAGGAAQSMQSKAESATADAERATSAEAAASQRTRRSGPSPSSSVELRRDTQLAPDAWLAHIRQLLRQGRRQQAIESLQLFRRAHPDWVLPQELQDLAD